MELALNDVVGVLENIDRNDTQEINLDYINAVPSSWVATKTPLELTKCKFIKDKLRHMVLDQFREKY